MDVDWIIKNPIHAHPYLKEITVEVVKLIY